MALKKLLGLEAFPISEAEIMKKIEEAYRHHREEIIFTSNRAKVTVKLGQLSPAGLMTDYRDYYAQ